MRQREKLVTVQCDVDVAYHLLGTLLEREHVVYIAPDMAETVSDLLNVSAALQQLAEDVILQLDAHGYTDGTGTFTTQANRIKAHRAAERAARVEEEGSHA